MDADEKIFGKKPLLVKRLSSGILELDWLYGFSRDKNGFTWGLPAKKMSIWAGISGVGKSRIGKSIAKNIYNKYCHINNNIVKYFSLEDDYDNPNSIYEITKLIRKNKPLVVFIDSINMLEEFGSGCDKNIKKIIREVRTVCNDLNTHIIFISQLNKAGDPRGSTTLPHLVDIVFEITNVKSHMKMSRPDYLRSVLDENIDKCVCFSVGDKHRYGRTGDEFRIIFKHNNSGVEIWSKNREWDHEWRGDNTDESYKFWDGIFASMLDKKGRINKKYLPLDKSTDSAFMWYCSSKSFRI